MTDKEAIKYAIKLKDFCRCRRTCKGCPLVAEGRCALDWNKPYKKEFNNDH